MNKQKFIELLKKPSSFTKEEVTGLENVVRQYPYFQSAHLVLAKGSRITKDPKTKRRLSRAAVYCTDRALLKRYINGELIFLDSVNAPPLKIEDEVRKKTKQSISLKPKVKSKPKKETPSNNSLEQTIDKEDPSFDAGTVLEGIKDRIEKYKENKKNFENYIQNDEEDKAVNDALNKASNIEELEEASIDVVPQEEEIEEPQVQNEIEDVPSTADKIQEDSTPSAKDDYDDFDISGIIEEIKNDNLNETEEKSESIEEESEFEIDNLIEKVIEEESQEEVNPTETEEKTTIEDSTDNSITEQVDDKTNIQDYPEDIEIEQVEEKTTDKVSIPESDKKDELEVKEDAPKPTYSNRIVISGSNKNKASKDTTKSNESEDSSTKPITSKIDPPKETSESIAEVKKNKKVTTEDNQSNQEELKTDISPVEHTDEQQEDIKESVAEKVTPEDNQSNQEEPKTDISPVEHTDEQQEDIKESVAEKVTPEDNQSNQEEPKTDISPVEHTDEQQEDTKDEILDSQEFQSHGVIHREKADDDDKKLSSGALRKAKMKKLKMQKDIINDFIDSSPSMPTPTPSFESEEEEKEVKKKDLAKEATKKEEEIISENMAIIYKNQRKIDKAIDIYKKLILKFPQKEAYFAARIKELNK